jgi:hypothetical protein
LLLTRVPENCRKGRETNFSLSFCLFDIEYNSNDDRRNNKSEQFSPGSTYVIMEKKTILELHIDIFFLKKVHMAVC